MLKIFFVTVDMSRLEHFPNFNKQGLWNKYVLGGKCLLEI